MNKKEVASRARQVKILHVFGRMDRGGAEMRTVDLLSHLNSNYIFHFATLTGLPGNLDAEIERLGGIVHPTALNWRFPRRFRLLVKRERYAVIHSHVHLFSGFILLLAALNGIPVRIAHFRSSDDGQKSTVRRRLQRRLMRTLVNRFATHILAVSESAMNAAWPAWRQDARCKVVYNGLSLEPFEETADRVGVRQEFQIPSHYRVFIHVGRFTEAKNHKRVVSIFREILKLDPCSHLLLVGGGDRELEYLVRQQLAENGLLGHTTLTGVRGDVIRLLKAADLLLFPSLWEGLPGAVLEAAAAGIPVLGSNIESIREIESYFGSVNTLPLAESDRVWAERAIQLNTETMRIAAEADLDHRQKERLEQFARSPFYLPVVAEAFEKVYSSWEEYERR